MALGRALGGGGALRRLGLSGNPLGERAGAAIVQGLDGSSVISLGLEVTEVPYACVVAANRLLALNQRRWEEARPRRFEHRRRELQATAEEVDAARVALAERRAEVEAQERRLDRFIMQLAIVTEGAEARKAADRDRCAPHGGAEGGRAKEHLATRRREYGEGAGSGIGVGIGGRVVVAVAGAVGCVGGRSVGIGLTQYEHAGHASGSYALSRSAGRAFFTGPCLLHRAAPPAHTGTREGFPAAAPRNLNPPPPLGWPRRSARLARRRWQALRRRPSSNR